MSRIRMLFSKLSQASFISHQDLPELFSRSARRAGLKSEWTQGFSPRPRLVLGPPLPMGVMGLAEPAEFWFESWNAGMLEGWNNAMIPGIRMLCAQIVEGVALAKLCDAATYCISARNFKNINEIIDCLQGYLEETGNLLAVHSSTVDFEFSVCDPEKAGVSCFVRVLSEKKLIDGWHDLSVTRRAVGRWDVMHGKVVTPVEESLQ